MEIPRLIFLNTYQFHQTSSQNKASGSLYKLHVELEPSEEVMVGKNASRRPEQTQPQNGKSNRLNLIHRRHARSLKYPVIRDGSKGINLCRPCSLYFKAKRSSKPIYKGLAGN